MLKTWSVNGNGSYVDGVKISEISLNDLRLSAHRSIRLRIEVKQDARHPGGINIYGKGFGNYDQDIVLRLRPPRETRRALDDAFAFAIYIRNADLYLFF